MEATFEEDLVGLCQEYEKFWPVLMGYSG